MIFTKVYRGFLVMVFLNFGSAYPQSLGNNQLKNVNNSIRTVLERLDFASNSLEQRGQESGFLKENVIELITRYGYPAERHRVVTKDGYILELHRIPYGKNNSQLENRPVAFLQHGLMSSSGDFVLAGPGKALPFLLSDKGYDVWLGNVRGNRWSRNHIKYNPDKDPEFWKFSWDKIGVIDLPTMIDYILEKTGQEKLFYIGHSQGTTIFFVMASEMPEYNEKIRLMTALAPIAFMSHIPSTFLRTTIKNMETITMIFDFLGINEFLSNSQYPFSLILEDCIKDPSFQPTCIEAMFTLFGEDYEQLNMTLAPLIFSHSPAGSSKYQLIHFGQEIRSGKFAKFDYGSERNKIVYGQSAPPQFALDKVTAPVVMYYSTNDALTGIEDLEELKSKLPNVVEMYRVKFDKFNHVDFLFAIDAPSLLFDKVIDMMGKY